MIRINPINTIFFRGQINSLKAQVKETFLFVINIYLSNIKPKTSQMTISQFFICVFYYFWCNLRANISFDRKFKLNQTNIMKAIMLKFKALGLFAMMAMALISCSDDDDN